MRHLISLWVIHSNAQRGIVTACFSQSASQSVSQFTHLLITAVRLHNYLSGHILGQWVSVIISQLFNHKENKAVQQSVNQWPIGSQSANTQSIRHLPVFTVNQPTTKTVSSPGNYPTSHTNALLSVQPMIHPVNRVTSQSTSIHFVSHHFGWTSYISLQSQLFLMLAYFVFCLCNMTYFILSHQ